jgi:hypothetical protein
MISLKRIPKCKYKILAQIDIAHYSILNLLLTINQLFNDTIHND